jgi:hypothetical protein
MISFLNSKYWVNIAFLLLLFMPNNAIGSLFQVILMVVLFMQTAFGKTQVLKKFSLLKLALVAWLLLVLFYSQLAGYSIYAQSTIKLVSIGLFFLLFPLKLKHGIDQRLILGATVIILITQVAYVLNLNPVIDLINTYYTSEGYFNSSEVVAGNTELEDVFNLRFGGIYRNSNQAGRMITMLFAISLLNFTRPQKRKWTILASLVLLFFGVLLTGSRTSFLVLILLSVSFVLYYLNINRTKVILGGLLFVLPVFLFIGSGNRLLNYSEFSGNAKRGSFLSKLNFLNSYIDETSLTKPTDLVFGKFNIDNFSYYYGQRINKFDSEIGYLIHAVGFVGLLLIVIFYLNIFVKSGPKTRFIMLLLFWMITSSVLTNFRFLTLFFLVLSLFYNFDQQEQQEALAESQPN